jgi:hypothetical protein
MRFGRLLQGEAFVKDRPHASLLNKVFQESEVFSVATYCPWNPDDDLLAAPPGDPLPSGNL